ERVLTTLLFVQFENDIWLQQTYELHRSYVRRNLTLYRGNEIEFSDLELFATFDGPARAIRCAVGILESSARLGLRARAALHTGECDVIGHKMAGPAGPPRPPFTPFTFFPSTFTSPPLPPF